MLQIFEPGDFLIFQIESGYGLLRVIAIDQNADETVWHLAAYGDLFLDVAAADVALAEPHNLTVTHPHIALTNRAFESTQVAKMKNVFLRPDETDAYERWKGRTDREVSDRSIRLMLGLR